MYVHVHYYRFSSNQQYPPPLLLLSSSTELREEQGLRFPSKSRDHGPDYNPVLKHQKVDYLTTSGEELWQPTDPPNLTVSTVVHQGPENVTDHHKPKKSLHAWETDSLFPVVPCSEWNCVTHGLIYKFMTTHSKQAACSTSTWHALICSSVRYRIYCRLYVYVVFLISALHMMM